MGRRQAPVTREKTLEGQVWEEEGIESASATGGRMMWKPLMKNSCERVSEVVGFSRPRGSLEEAVGEKGG